MENKLDCRGMSCPKPVMATRDLITATKPEELAVIVDNEAAVENVSRFLGRNGYNANSAKTGAAEWIISAKKEGGAQIPAGGLEIKAEEMVCQAGGRKTLVFITSETMGRGDEELGAKLMLNFLATLPELGPDLWRIVMLNGGVKLSTIPGPNLDSLKKLAASGVSILVCGTCLSHYGLLEQKQIGETTNMLDIVTSLALADKIIRP